MEHYDLAIGWQWEYDREFCEAVEREAQHRRNLTTYQIREDNVDLVLRSFKQGKLRFGLYLDRAFDVDDRFEELGRAMLKESGNIVNHYDHTVEAVDKATMHLQFLNAGLHVPFSIIISPYADVQETGLTIEDLARLGRPFIIKPANTTGGGIGVVTGAETLLDVIETRKELRTDKYLLQEKIIPKCINGRRCWFRCYYVFGKVFLAWWDDLSHLYQLVSTDEEHFYKLRPLRRIMKSIAKICGLEFFSSEIALREASPFEPSRFIIVDYVNDMCDMRSIDIAHDGLPNALLRRIVERLALAAFNISRQNV